MGLSEVKQGGDQLLTLCGEDSMVGETLRVLEGGEWIPFVWFQRYRYVIRELKLYRRK